MTAKVSARASVHEQAARNLHAKDGDRSAGRAFQLALVDVGIQRGHHGVVADLAYPAFNRVQAVERNAPNLPGPVVHSEDDGPAPGVGEGRQLVCKVVSVRTPDPATGHHHALQLQGRVLSETDAPGQVFKLVHVRRLPFNGRFTAGSESPRRISRTSGIDRIGSGGYHPYHRRFGNRPIRHA